jgi:hypothetical protein
MRGVSDLRPWRRSRFEHDGLSRVGSWRWGATKHNDISADTRLAGVRRDVRWLMATFVEVPLPDGGSLIVERAEDEGVVRAGRLREIAETAGESFESAVDRVKRAALVVQNRLSAIDVPPDEVTVEFAIKLATEVGVVVASSSAEANLKLIVRWIRR